MYIWSFVQLVSVQLFENYNNRISSIPFGYKICFLKLISFSRFDQFGDQLWIRKKREKKIISLRSVAKFLTQILLITFPDCLLTTTTTKTVANAAVGDDDNDEYD